MIAAIGRFTSLRRLDAEVDSLRDALRFASREAEPGRELALAAGAWHYWWVRGYLAEGRAIIEGILDRRGLVLTRAGIRITGAVAGVAWGMGEGERAGVPGQQALDAAVGIGDVIKQLSAHTCSGSSRPVAAISRPPKATSRRRRDSPSPSTASSLPTCRGSTSASRFTTPG
ncbi:MAG: hypothetical protein H0U58_07945 [Chloroflexi bacterium]|nr:hypothetical protein [Chloroflexota bacterium]